MRFSHNTSPGGRSHSVFWRQTLPRAGKSRFRRGVCLLLALLLSLSFALCGCGDVRDGDTPSGGTETDTPSGAPSGEIPSGDGEDGNGTGGALVYRAPEKTLAGLPDYTPDGALIIAADNRCGGILGEHTLLGSAYDGVNAAIRERFGAEAYLQAYSEEELFSKTKTAAGSEGAEFFADLLVIPLSSLPDYLEADLLIPLSELPGFSSLALDAGADGAMDGVLPADTRALAVDGQCYALLGSGALSELGGICLLFNHTLLDALVQERPDLYAEVKSGGFTWGRLLAILRAAEGTLTPAPEGGSDSVSAISEGNSPEGGLPGYEGETVSLFGTTLSDASLKAAVYRSCGASLLTDAPEGGYSLDALDALAALSEYGILTGDAADAAFREGDLLFLVTTLDALYDYPNSDGSWGCLPLPKKNEGAEGYACMLDPESTPVFVAPKGSLRLETKSGYLTALYAAAHYACLPAFSYELLSGFIREGDSMEMLPLLLESVTADPLFLSPDSPALLAGLDTAVAARLAGDLPDGGGTDEAADGESPPAPPEALPPGSDGPFRRKEGVK